MKDILVTGGGGFLGKAIVSQLLEKGHRVTSLSRKRSPFLDKIGVNQIRGDITDPDAVSRALTNRDVVFHTAAKAGVWGPYQDFFSANVTGTRNILAACHSCQVPILVHTSSPSVVFDGKDMAGADESTPYPGHFSAPYPQTKALAEQEVAAAAGKGMKTVVLRPHLIWGPADSHLVPRILARAARLRRVGDGSNIVDTIYVDNAASAHVLAMEALEKNPALSGKIYFISDDAPIRLWEMVDRILAAGGKPPVTRSVSPKTAYRMGVAMEWIYRACRFSGEPPMTRFVAKELATSHWFDISAAKRDLGYMPAISIEKGLEQLRVWLERNGLTEKIEKR